ncbi:transposase [Candidatus Pacearchaeota archaeon]|nr:transposase [Candidatus Pacearchaeota archaeon]
MTFIRYKTFGKQEYAYQIKSYWDTKTQKPKQKTVYLGVVIDKPKKIFEKRLSLPKQEKLILDFGDSYFIKEFFEKVKFSKLIEEIFGDKKDFFLSLINYRLCYPSAMRFSKTWFEGNYAKICYHNVNLTSQRISDFLKFLGDENLQRKFFKQYIPDYAESNEGIIIDATSLPNQIHMPITQWGLSGEEIDKQIRFLLVVDKKNSMPLFFRYFSGNIVDVSTLKNTINELQKFGIKENYVYMDAGFFSEDNILELYEQKINFLTRLPSLRTTYKELINSEVKNIKRYENAVQYGKRALFIKQKKINLFGKDAFAYIVLDPERKGRETKNFLLQNIKNTENSTEELEYNMLKRGIMILVSSFNLKNEDIVPAYYVRQTAEKLFGFSKDDLNLLPLRIHNEETLRGFLFMQFVTLIAFVHIKNKLGKEHNVEEILLKLRNLKCKVYENEIIICEPNKQQKEILEKLDILMPKKLGI